jgi:hypothetical protein
MQRVQSFPTISAKKQWTTVYVLFIINGRNGISTTIAGKDRTMFGLNRLPGRINVFLKARDME